MKLKEIKPNPNNPRVIRDEKFKKLVKSLQEFPQMMGLRPIVIDENNTVLGGNMRLKALQELGYKDIPNEWVKKASELTEEQKKEFIIKDNVGFGEWYWDILANEWDTKELEGWGIDIPVIGGAEGDLGDFHDTGALPSEKYGVIVICGSEAQQIEVFNELSGNGYSCKIVVV